MIRPKVLALDLDSIPKELQSLDRWVLWRNMQRTKPSGEKVWAKMPLSAKGGAGSSTDAATWVSFDAAVDEYLMGDYDGIGIVLGNDLHGIDLDDCRDPVSGALSALAQETLDRVEGYAEVSPSGTGIKIFTQTNLDGSRTKKEAGVELYKDGRYFTVTGHAINGHNALPELPQDLGWLVERVWGEGLSAAASGDAFENLKGPLDGWELDRVIEEVLVHLDPDVGYGEWLKVGAALHHQGGGDGDWLEAWDNWSAASGKWIEGQCLAKWDSFSQQRAGRGAVTLASLLHMTKDKREARATVTRKDLEARIDSTSDFDELTKVTLKAVFEAVLPEADTSLLIKIISKKTNVPVKALTKDGAKYRRVDASSQQLHLTAAKAVIELLGKSDMIFAQGQLWHWSESGVWAEMDDRQLKQKIHKVAENTKLTGNVVNSILDMIKTEVNKVGVVFAQRRDSINCINGELIYCDYLCFWEKAAHVREHYQTAQIPIIYDPDARAPRFEKFLEEVFAADIDAAQKRLLIEEALGYTLMSSCHLEKFFLLIGMGANGKSVLLAIVAALVGPKLVTAVQPSNFDNRFQRGHLAGKLANIVTEIAQGAEIADDKLKSLVSGELTTAEGKFKPPFDFKPIATHWFGTNHMPRTRDFSEALFRRAVTLSFNNRFEGDRRDVNLIAKLLAELPGILNIALRGAARLLVRKDFTECPSSDAIKDEWRLEADQVRQFVEECCGEKPDERVASRKVFISYQVWAREAGINRTVSKNTFSSRLQGLGFPNRKGTKGERQVVGLELLRNDF